MHRKGPKKSKTKCQQIRPQASIRDYARAWAGDNATIRQVSRFKFIIVWQDDSHTHPVMLFDAKKREFPATPIDRHSKIGSKYAI